MKLQMGKYLLITGLVIFVFIIGELAVFQEGYMRLNHQIDNSAKYQTNAVINDIEFKDDIAFLAEGSMGIEIVNFSHMDKPKFLARYLSAHDINSISVEDNLLYVINSAQQIEVINVSHPNSPELITTYAPLFSKFNVLQVSNTTGFALTDTGTLKLVDFSEINRITEKNLLPLGAKISVFSQLNQKIICLDESGNILIYNRSSAADLEIISQIEGNYTNFEKIIPVQQRNWISICSGNGMIIYDLSDPKNPDLILNETNSDNNLVISDIQVSNNDILILNQTNGWIYGANFSQIEQQGFSAFHPIFRPNIGYDHAYIDGFMVRKEIFFAIRFEPRIITYYAFISGDNFDFKCTYHYGFAPVKDLIWDDENSIIVYAAGQAGIKMVNYSEKEGFISLSDFSNEGFYTRLYRFNSYLYAQNYENSLDILDVSDLQHPKLLNSWNFSQFQLFDMEFTESLGFVAAGEGGILVYNFSLPDKPVPFLNITDIGKITDLKIHESYLFAVEADYGIKIFDISNVSNINQISSYSDDICREGVLEMVLYQDMIYAFGSFPGILMIDVHFPAYPIYYGLYQSDYGSVSYLAIDQSVGYVGYKSGVLEYVEFDESLSISSKERYYSSEKIESIFILPEIILVANDYGGLLSLERSFIYGPSYEGSIAITITFIVGMIAFIAGLVIHYQTRETRFKLDELRHNFSHHLHGIPRDDLLEVCKIIMPFIDDFHFVNQGHKLIREIFQLFKEGKTNEEDSQELGQKLDELYQFYQYSSLELAEMLAKGKDLNFNEMERILHEGGYRERIVLENSLPSSHFLIYGLTQKLELKSKNGKTIMR